MAERSPDVIYSNSLQGTSGHTIVHFSIITCCKLLIKLYMESEALFHVFFVDIKVIILLYTELK